MGSGCIDPHFLDLGTSWRWVVNFTPRPLYPRGKSLRYPLDRRFGGPQSRSGRFGEKKILDPTETRTPIPRSSSLQLVAVPTTLGDRAVLLLITNWVYMCNKSKHPIQAPSNSHPYTWQYFQQLNSDRITWISALILPNPSAPKQPRWAC
jgi:hypothetical protein